MKWKDSLLLIEQENFEQKLSKSVLDFYAINDLKKQIIDYHETYEKLFAGKVISDEELEFSLKNGFYIGEKRCRLGDCLTHTPLPYYLKQKWPECRVFVRDNKIAREIFRGNPYVDGIVEIKGREPIGASREFGFGNALQRRLRTFRVFTLNTVKPMLFLDKKAEWKFARWRKKLPLSGRKLALIQSAGKTVKKILSTEQWREIIKELEDEFYFVQIGIPRNQRIPAHKNMRRKRNITDMMALMKQADVFIGLNSGLMHLAAGLNVPAVILHNQAPINEFRFPLLADNEALPRKVNPHLFYLYPDNHHIVMREGMEPVQGLNANIMFFSFENMRNAMRASLKGE